MFSWRYLDSGRGARPSEPFPDRDAAEAWMGAAWQDLLAAGHEEVALRDDERETTVYRMGLREVEGTPPSGATNDCRGGGVRYIQGARNVRPIRLLNRSPRKRRVVRPLR